eukprot:jgi/Bigna1/64103/fgenesh1_kg.67_\
MVKNEVSYLKSLVKQSKLKLCSAFLEWYRAEYGDPTKTRHSDAPGPQIPDNGAEDVLDDAEQFDNLERQRIMEEDPDSLAFFNARKTMVATMKRKKIKGRF